MPIRLTEVEVQEVQRLESEAVAASTGYWRVYEYIADRMTAHGAPSTDPSYLWLRGVTSFSAENDDIIAANSDIFFALRSYAC